MNEDGDNLIHVYCYVSESSVRCSVDIGQLVVVSLPVTLGEEPVLGLVVGVGPLGEPPAGREQ